MIYVIATFEIKPGSMPQIMEAVLPCIEATRKEKGCISYDLLHSVTDEHAIVFVERWENRAALEAHFNEPHLVTWRELGTPHFVGRTIEIIDPANIETL